MIRAKELSREPLNTVDIELDSTHPFLKFIKDNIGKEADIDCDKALELWEALGIPNLIRSIQDPTLKEQARVATRPFPFNTGVFTEALINAIEHGSEFGRKGNVLIQVMISNRAFLFSVIDNGDGISEESIKQSQPKENGRGNGLLQSKRSSNIIICDKLQSGFRISVFFVLLNQS